MPPDVSPQSNSLHMVPPADGGVRQAWESIPAHLRAQVETWLGSAVIEAQSQPKGFSPGVASRLLTANGRRAFLKAACSIPNLETPLIHRREALMMQAMPSDIPAPRLLWSLDEGAPGWIMMLFEDIDGRHPNQPWQAGELQRVVAAMADLASRLTPSPPLPVDIALSAGDAIATRWNGWQRLQADAALLAKADAWSQRHIEPLVALEGQAPDALAGDTLLHFDIRADNILLNDRGAWFVDWPWACVGAAWVDVVGFAPSVTMQGGPPPEEVIALHPAAVGADPAAITAMVAALAGFFTQRALLPAPPGLPTLRAFQDAQGQIARSWLAQRTGWRP